MDAEQRLSSLILWISMTPSESTAVAMCVNDIACSGGEPLFFLDYIACGKNYPEKIATIVSGVAEGCKQSGAALVGGETAEHPGLMPEDEYDLSRICSRCCR